MYNLMESIFFTFHIRSPIKIKYLKVLHLSPLMKMKVTLSHWMVKIVHLSSWPNSEIHTNFIKLDYNFMAGDGQDAEMLQRKQ